MHMWFPEFEGENKMGSFLSEMFTHTHTHTHTLCGVVTQSMRLQISQTYLLTPHPTPSIGFLSCALHIYTQVVESCGAPSPVHGFLCSSSTSNSQELRYTLVMCDDTLSGKSVKRGRVCCTTFVMLSKFPLMWFN